MKSPLRGYNLIEFLLAFSLSVLIAAWLMQLFISINKRSSFIHSKLLLQQDQRQVLHFLNAQIKKAKDWRCVSKKTAVNFIMAYKANALPAAYVVSALANSEVLVIKRCYWINNHWQLIRRAYFVADSRRSKKLPIDAFYYKNIPGHRVEVSENISQLRFLFAIKQGGNLLFRKLMQISDWHQVVGVEYFLSDKISSFVAIQSSQ